jgi:hypothetical protein
VAIAADHVDADRCAAVSVLEEDRGAGVAGEVLVAEGDQGGEDGVQVSAHVGEAVLEAFALAGFAVGDFGENASFDELVETGGEDVAGDAEVALEVVETAETAEDVSEHEERPPVADEFEGALSRAVRGQRRRRGVGHVPRLLLSAELLNAIQLLGC